MSIVRGPHYEPRHGTVKQATDYCKGLTPEKGMVLNPTFVEFGDVKGLSEPTQGKRNDLLEATQKCFNKDQLAKEFPVVFIKFHRGFEAFWNQRRRSSTKAVVPGVHWLCGPTGCGKTRTAIEECKERPWMSSKNLEWFDNYDGQKYVIFDDFRKECCAFNFFLRITDRHGLDVPVKGGFTWWNPEVIFITCPRLPCEEFVKHGGDVNVVYEDVEQVNRRCATIRQWNVALNTWVYKKGAPMHE